MKRQWFKRGGGSSESFPNNNFLPFLGKCLKNSERKLTNIFFKLNIEKTRRGGFSGAICKILKRKDHKRERAKRVDSIERGSWKKFRKNNNLFSENILFEFC